MISLDLTNEPSLKHMNLIPGNKLCRQCRTKVHTLKNDVQNLMDVDDPNNKHIDPEMFDIKEEVSTEEDKKALNEIFSTIGMSPIKAKGLHDSGKVSLGKRKISSLLDIVKCKVARIFKVPEESFVENNKIELIEKAKMFDNFKDVFISKLQELKSTKSKIQLMTLLPTDWPISKVLEIFPVTQYVVKEARKIVKEKGVLVLPDKKKGKVLPDDTLKAVDSFYHDDEYSREMPGKKDCVSIRKNVFRQKRLLLCNLNELYSEFKNTNPNIKIGFSKFCELRPKWCILAGGTGTHTVCVYNASKYNSFITTIRNFL